MRQVIRSGIPVLDELIEGSRSANKDHKARIGYHVPDEHRGATAATVSFCILGPDGTGKSALALHIASRYLADARQDNESTKVVYVSTDLTHAAANKMWLTFGLNLPNRRQVPFFRPRWPSDSLEISLNPFSPEQMEDLAAFVDEPQGNICFLDLASHTAGDDWGMVGRMLALLGQEKVGAYPPLVIVDSIEGFETLAGDLDAFGERGTRRGRLAHLIRTASGRAHLVLIAEEPEEGHHLPEQFVADVVIRLRTIMVKGYVRRTLELEKVRGQSHRRGQHPFTIRSGGGSTTGKIENPDDRVTRLNGELQSYLHVFPSLHRLSRRIMEDRSDIKTEAPRNKYAAFGITYLDDTLAGAGPGEGATTQRDGSDNRGLPWSSITALIGDAGTQKTWLGHAFLARTFISYAARLLQTVGRRTPPNLATLCPGLDSEGVRKRTKDVALLTPDSSLTAARDLLVPGKQLDLEELCAQVRIEQNMSLRSCRTQLEGVLDNERFGQEIRDLATILIGFSEGRMTFSNRVAHAYLLSAIPPELGPAVTANDGVPVLLATNDIHHVKLASEFERWIRLELPGVEKYGKDARTFWSALRCRMRDITVCRRFEVHDVSSPVLVHTVSCAIRRAQDLLFGETECHDAPKRELFQRSGRIRLVIDDFSTLRETYADVREDSTFLPFLLFQLGREGITGLIIDTHAGRPDLQTPELLESELRSLVQQRLYTWRVSFFGQNRVAIAAIPPISKRVPALVRELRWYSESEGRNAVDPHLEMYSGLEEGKPRPVPLEVRLFIETPAFEKYRNQENAAWKKLFTPRRLPHAKAQHIIAQEHSGYETLRDLCHLHRDTLLDHTLVFQIDEFWGSEVDVPGTTVAANGKKTEETHPFRSEALRSQYPYMNSLTRDEAGRSTLVDPFGVFREFENQKRNEFFVYPGYELEETQCHSINRIPFTWDFGFLLYQHRMWDAAAGQRFRTDHLAGRMSVAEVLASSDVTWRQYLGACRAVAQNSTTALDLSMLAPQSLSCLLLEVWLSEVYETKELERAGVGAAWANRIGRRQWAGTDKNRHSQQHSRSEGRRAGEQRASVGEDLVSLLTAYEPELYMAWLLLAEVLPLSLIAGAQKNHDDRLLHAADANAVATRHWYKTACHVTCDATPSPNLTMRRLPGRFTTRGDWFLAVAAGSRSGVLADRALDLFSSKRANFARLRLGLGLPTRGIADSDQFDEIRTAISLTGRDGERSVSYKELQEHGADGKGFWWLWRSSLKHYDYQAKVWERAVSRIVTIWNEQRSGKERVEDCFNAYDRLCAIRKARAPGLLAPDDDGVSDNLRALEELDSRRRFIKVISFLRQQLVQATPEPLIAQRGLDWWPATAWRWAMELFPGTPESWKKRRD